jgi:hypothetical protein
METTNKRLFIPVRRQGDFQSSALPTELPSRVRQREQPIWNAEVPAQAISLLSIEFDRSNLAAGFLIFQNASSSKWPSDCQVGEASSLCFFERRNILASPRFRRREDAKRGRFAYLLWSAPDTYLHPAVRVGSQPRISCLIPRSPVAAAFSVLRALYSDASVRSPSAQMRVRE